MEEKELIRAACKKQGCKEKDLLSSRVTDKVVVLIVGPVGFKYIVPLADLETPAPVTAARVEAPPVTAKAVEKPAASKKK